MIIEFPSTSRMRQLIEARVPHAQALFHAAVVAHMRGEEVAPELIAQARAAYADLSPAEQAQAHPPAPPTNLVPLVTTGFEFAREVMKLLKK